MLFLYDTEILYLFHGLFENNIAPAFLIAISIFFFHLKYLLILVKENEGGRSS